LDGRRSLEIEGLRCERIDRKRPAAPAGLHGAHGGGTTETRPHDPTDGVYATSADYIHALELRGPLRLLFVSGTMGLDGDGVAGKTLEQQLDLVWANIRAILASADMTVENIVRLTSYLRDTSFAEANARARVAALGGRLVPTTAIVAETLDDTWLVEIEVVAAD